jgi:SH3-like domain-containing protein
MSHFQNIFSSNYKNMPKYVGLFLTILMLGFLSCEQSRAQEDDSGSLPRFASTRAQPINVRVGPGTRYDIAWEFKKSGLPVEIIQEFDVWRKIEYIDGEQGWIHQNLLTKRRSAITRPFNAAGRTAIYAQPLEGAKVRAWLEAGFLVTIKKCENGWCEVETPSAEGVRRFAGHIVQFELWGVYPDEVVN